MCLEGNLPVCVFPLSVCLGLSVSLKGLMGLRGTVLRTLLSHPASPKPWMSFLPASPSPPPPGFLPGSLFPEEGLGD